MVKLEIRANSYYDSVTLMLISKDLKKLPGIEEALVGMGTDLNKEISHNIGLNSSELDAITGNDFFIAVKCRDEAAMEAAMPGASGSTRSPLPPSATMPGTPPAGVATTGRPAAIASMMLMGSPS